MGNEPVGDVGADGGLVMLQDVHLDREGPGQAGHVPAPVPHLVVVALRLEDPPEGQTRISAQHLQVSHLKTEPCWVKEDWTGILTDVGPGPSCMLVVNKDLREKGQTYFLTPNRVFGLIIVKVSFAAD